MGGGPRPDTIGERLHTVAQLARRVGLSDGRVRALWAEDRRNLPTIDAFDADGHPLWFADTIDAWWRWRSRTKRDLVAALVAAKAGRGNEEETGNGGNPRGAE